MPRTAFPPAAAVFLAFFLAFFLFPMPTQAEEPLAPPQDSSPDQAAQQDQQGQQPRANLPLHMDLDLAREHQRFTEFAIEQMRRMNETMLGGINSMQVEKLDKGLYRASYKAIDVDGIICQVRRAESDPNYFVGSVLYTEQVLESVGNTPAACRKGEFTRVSEKQSRIIYSSKFGGGWQ